MLLANFRVGTTAAGLLVAWAAYSVPLMLLSFSASVLTLVWTSRRLANASAAARCARPAAPG